MRPARLLAPLAILALAVPALAAGRVADPVATEMSLTTPDGFILKGTLALPPTKGKVPVVILAHQFHADRSGWAPLAEKLHARGIGTLALDLRGHGESTQKAGAEVKVSDDFAASAKAVGFDRIPADLGEVAAWVRKQHGVDARRIGLAGASVGAFSVILAEPLVHPIAVLSLSPAGNVAFGDHALDELKAAVLKGRASLLVLASADDKGAFDNAEALKGLPGVDVLVNDGKAHGFDYFKDRTDTMAVFFGEYLGYHHLGMAHAAAAKKAPEKKDADALK
jgi:dienelactone hydrolase